MATSEILYEESGQAGAFDLLIAGGIAIGITIVILVIMSIVSLKTWGVVQPIVDTNLASSCAAVLCPSGTGTVTDLNYLAYKQSSFAGIGSGFRALGTFGSFIPVVVIVVVAGIVLAILGGTMGRGAVSQGGAGL